MRAFLLELCLLLKSYLASILWVFSWIFILVWKCSSEIFLCGRECSVYYNRCLCVAKISLRVTSYLLVCGHFWAFFVYQMSNFIYVCFEDWSLKDSYSSNFLLKVLSFEQNDYFISCYYKLSYNYVCPFYVPLLGKEWFIFNDYVIFTNILA